MTAALAARTGAGKTATRATRAARGEQPPTERPAPKGAAGARNIPGEQSTARLPQSAAGAAEGRVQHTLLRPDLPQRDREHLVTTLPKAVSSCDCRLPAGAVRLRHSGEPCSPSYHKAGAFAPVAADPSLSESSRRRTSNRCNHRRPRRGGLRNQRKNPYRKN